MRRSRTRGDNKTMTVKVKRERPDQRRYHRVTAPLYVRLGEAAESVRAADWSLGGLRVVHYPGELPQKGGELELHLTLPFQGFDLTFTVKAEVVRSDPVSASFAVEFTQVGERERNIMAHFIEDLVRGAMASVEDQIQRIDVPVTPASTEADATSKEVPERRLPLRQLVWGGAYALLGFAVFGYMALVAYSNVFRMEVQTAVVTSPVESVMAPGDGQLMFVRAAKGQPLAGGETVLYFADHDIEKQIDLAKIEIQKREAQLTSLMRSESSSSRR